MPSPYYLHRSWRCLTWKDHVRYVISKVGKRVGVLGRLRRNIAIQAAFEMYNSLILPIFDYCDVVWSSCNKVNNNK